MVCVLPLVYASAPMATTETTVKAVSFDLAYVLYDLTSFKLV